MKLHSDQGRSGNRISAYGAGYFVVNEVRYEGSLFVTPERIVENRAPKAFDDLDAPALREVADMEPEVVLLGTGNVHRFPDADVMAPVIGRGIGVEVMTTDAACRTYNILVSEGRRVIAVLIAMDA